MNFAHLFEGFLVGLAYVAPIGMQNLYVINAATTLSQKKAMQVTFTTIIMDILLALFMFFGVGSVIDSNIILRRTINIVGAIMIIIIGINLIRADTSDDEEKDINLNMSLSKIIFACFSITWLNPQAIIDGTMLLANARTEYSNIFIIGVNIASIIWFTFVLTVSLKLQDFFSPKIMRYINIICGIIIIILGLKLGYGFFKDVLNF